MRAKPQPDQPATPGAFVPVGPSVIVKLFMAPMSAMLNPLVAKLSGRRHFSITAQIHHIGRRSGKSYMTSAGARVNGDTVLIPLTFGNQSDWARNVRAAGECWIVLNGRRYHAVEPRFLDAKFARPLLRADFKAVERLAFRFLGIKQFMRLRVAS